MPVKLGRVLLLTLLVTLAFAAQASATQVTGVTVDNTVPSNAAGAVTSYVVQFTATTALSTGQSITVALPPGTDITSKDNGDTVVDTAAPGTTIGSCSRAAATATCNIFASGVAAGHTVKITLNGVLNPGVGGYTADVSTTTDTTPATSAAYSVVTAQNVSSVAVTNTIPTNAGGAVGTYTVTFNTSAVGGLNGAAGSRITLTFPANTDLTSFDNGDSVKDLTVSASTVIGSCSRVGLVATCSIFSGSSVGASHQVAVTLNGVQNPPAAGGLTATVSTTSDGGTASSPYATVANNPVSGVTVNNTTPTNAAGAVGSYTVNFTTSATGGMDGPSGSTITIQFPANTDLTTFDNGDAVKDLTVSASTVVGGCSRTGLVATCNIFSGSSIGAGHQVSVTLNGVKNPPASGALTASVFTSSDTPATSGAYSTVAGGTVTPATVTNTAPTSAAGAITSYTVTFNTSATGGLDGPSGSQITITLPAGTDLTTFDNGDSVRDLTTSATTVVGSCSRTGLVATCFIFSGSTIGAGHQVSVTLNGIKNPPASAGLTAVVSTTSDGQANSGTYATVASHALPAVTVDNTKPTSAAGGLTTYTFTFNTSATGGLDGVSGSEITITFPAGTNITTFDNGDVVKDLTTSATTAIGSCSRTGQVATCNLFSGNAAAAGHQISVTLNGIVNPPAATGLTTTVSTTSDTQVTSGTFATVGNHAVSNVALAVSNTAPNATGVTYTTTFNTSSTGGLDGLSGSFITAHYLPGTDFTASSMTVRDTTTNTVVGSCSDTANVLECLLFFSETIGPFDAVEVKATNVKNTSDGAVGAVATVSTSSDVGTTVDTATPTPTATATPSPTATATTPTPTATSSPGLPVAVADKPVVKSTTSLTLSAVVNPMGLPTTMHFEYGTSAGTVGRAVTFLKTPDQDVGSDNVPHTVTATVNGLLPNSDYQVRAVAVNSAGTQVSDPQTVSTPADPPPPPPKLGETFNIEPVSGVVLVKGANGQLVPLTEASQIVPGALIDARKGELSLTTSAVGGKKKKLQKGNFKRGLFTVRQFKKSKLKGLVDLRLALRDTSGIPLTKGCNQRRDALLGTTAKKPKKVLNTLQSDAKGSFRTTGKYSAATVRGTKWDVADRCDGTLTTVHRGVVSVEDFTKRKTVNVRAGKSYFAAAKA